MGKGRFLMDLARLHPEINYIGIERYTSVLLRAVQKIETHANQGIGIKRFGFSSPHKGVPYQPDNCFPWHTCHFANNMNFDGKLSSLYMKIISRCQVSYSIRVSYWLHKSYELLVPIKVCKNCLHTKQASIILIISIISVKPHKIPLRIQFSHCTWNSGV